MLIICPVRQPQTISVVVFDSLTSDRVVVSYTGLENNLLIGYQSSGVKLGFTGGKVSDFDVAQKQVRL
jgi:hypothetical protein